MFPREFRRRLRLSTRSGKCAAMNGRLFLPLVETIAPAAEFTSNLGSRALAGIEQLDCLSLKFWSEPSSLTHVAPPRGYRALFKASVKPGPAQNVPFGLPGITNDQHVTT